MLEAFTSTLGRDEREQQLTQLVRVHTEDLPSISLFFRAQPRVYANALRGPKLVPPEGNMSWNIQEWELR